MNRNRIRQIIDRADLRIDGTVSRSEGGLPIGNGKMGTLVWTSPSCLKTQINRVDVFANNSESNSFNERHLDYGYACAFVDIDFAGFSKDVFDENTKQHLALYTADGQITGSGVQSDFFACEGKDVFVFSVQDERTDCSEGVSVRLKMLRDSEVKTKSHLAVSRFFVMDDVMVLKQEFIEGDYYCASAVAVKVCGKPCRIRYQNESGGRHPGIVGREPIVIGKESETEIRMYLQPGAGAFDVFVSSAASFQREEDPVGQAVELVRQGAVVGRKQLKAEQEAAWGAFWNKSYIELWGNEEADLVEQHYNYFMYLMRCCSMGGKYPPNFGGLLFSTRGDLRHWGAMQWWNNLQIYYNAVMPSGRYELAMPYFSQWNQMYDRLATAARQQWDSQGIYIPETVGFDGPEVLPDEIAKELADLMLLRKPWAERSQEFIQFANKKRPHESRWNFKTNEVWKDGELQIKDRESAPFGPVTHMLGSQVGVAFLYWEYYRFSGDLEYFKTYGYPILRGVAEFFHHFPNLRKGEDQKYHAFYTNCSEGYFGSIDSLETMCAMYGIFPMAIKASELLETDEELRLQWREIYENLAPLPVLEEGGWASAAQESKEFGGKEKRERGPNSTPCCLFELCTLETAEKAPELYQTGKCTVDRLLSLHTVTSRYFVHEMSSMGRVLAHMGYGEEMGKVLVGQIGCINAGEEYCFYVHNGQVPQFENRLTAREGVNAMSAQRLGNVAAALQQGLLQSSGGDPAAEPVLRLFPALPAGWNARFALYAKGGFRVEACCENGVIGRVTVTSLLGNRLRVRGLAGKKVTVNGTFAGTAGELLELDTQKGDQVLLD